MDIWELGRGYGRVFEKPISPRLRQLLTGVNPERFARRASRRAVISEIELYGAVVASTHDCKPCVDRA